MRKAGKLGLTKMLLRKNKSLMGIQHPWTHSESCSLLGMIGLYYFHSHVTIVTETSDVP